MLGRSARPARPLRCSFVSRATRRELHSKPLGVMASLLEERDSCSARETWYHGAAIVRLITQQRYALRLPEITEPITNTDSAVGKGAAVH